MKYKRTTTTSLEVYGTSWLVTVRVGVSILLSSRYLFLSLSLVFLVGFLAFYISGMCEYLNISLEWICSGFREKKDRCLPSACASKRLEFVNLFKASLSFINDGMAVFWAPTVFDTTCQFDLASSSRLDSLSLSFPLSLARLFSLPSGWAQQLLIFSTCL